jgi:flagellin-like hook-associated protein FlgL
MLQRSLNRLSSGSRIVSPSDDAGGTAVAMRLSANAKRSGSAATNINNAISLLQNQDGALKVGGKILERMAELQSLWNDATKNTEDKSLYDIEFHALQGQLESLSQEKFNGVNIFGATSTDIITSAAGDQTLTISAKGVGVKGAIGTASTATGSDDFATASAGTLKLNGVSIPVTATDDLDSIIDKINKSTDSTVTASKDGSKIVLTNKIFGTQAVDLTDSTPAVLTALKLATPDKVAGTADTRDKIQLLIQAGSLGDKTVDGVDLDVNKVIEDAQNEFASYRAHNGAEQNGLNFAAELLTLNKANLEAATGRITDVDVAEESTQLAKWTTLTQAGTAMLAQANQANSLVLKLIGQ